MSVYYVSKCPDYLEHHGIKGQKWGERNYQYKDGSLTPAGRKRYLKGATLKEKIADAKSKFEAAKKKRAEEREAKLLEKEKKLQEKEEIRARKEENLRMEAELRSEKNLAKFQKKQIKHQKRVDRGKKLLTAALLVGGVIAIKKLSDANTKNVVKTKTPVSPNTTPTNPTNSGSGTIENLARIRKALSGSLGSVPVKNIV